MPGAKLARRQRGERRRIGQHQLRRVESADQVLPFRQIHAGLAADGAIDLSDERGRHVHQSDAAKIAGGNESGDVADDASARSHEQRAAVGARANQLPAEALHAWRCSWRVSRSSKMIVRRRPDAAQSAFELACANAALRAARKAGRLLVFSPSELTAAPARDRDAAP